MTNHADSPIWRLAVAKANAINKRKYPAPYGCDSRVYRIWKCMHFRCYQKSHKAFPRYGGRGIFVCEEWRDSYMSFLEWALESGYEDGLTVERINNDGPYSPANCRWATMKEQQSNRSDTVMVTAFGETKCIADWGNDPRCSITITSLHKRLVGGMRPEVAITSPHKRAVGRKPTDLWTK